MQQPASLLPVPIPPLEVLKVSHDVLSRLYPLLQTFTKHQRRYLVARAGTTTHEEALRIAGAKHATLRLHWRLNPAFKEAESLVLQLSRDDTVALARALYQKAMPTVAERQIDQATEDHHGLSDRELMAQQRAREAVTKGAGMESGLAPGEERLEVIAMRLWRKSS